MAAFPSLSLADPRTWSLAACAAGLGLLALGQVVEGRAAFHAAPSGLDGEGAFEEKPVQDWLLLRSHGMAALAKKVGRTLLVLGGLALWLAIWTL